MSWPDPIEAALYLAVGLATGGVYFAALFWMIRAHVSRSLGLVIVPLSGLRFGGAALVFWFVAQQGAAALLTALLGFLLARALVRRLVGTE